MSGWIFLGQPPPFHYFFVGEVIDKNEKLNVLIIKGFNFNNGELKKGEFTVPSDTEHKKKRQLFTEKFSKRLSIKSLFEEILK